MLLGLDHLGEVAVGVLRLAGTPWIPEPGPHVWLGVGLIAACHLELIPPIAAFVKEGRGTQAPFDPPRSLVTRGLYTRIRNPMYLVYTVVIVGEAMAFRSAWLAVYALFFWGLAHVYVVAVEEKTLRRRFGHRYEEYCRRVGRWLPRRRV